MNHLGPPHNPMHLLVSADVGGWATYHVGDEAMLDANLGVLRGLLPQARTTVVSSDPTWTSAEYGVSAVPHISFGEASGNEWSDRGSPLALHPNQDAESSDTFEAVRCLEQANGLVISGGGNLSDSWPEKIHERIVLFRAARARNLPILLLGQTIGPDLSGQCQNLVSELLRGSSWVGVRDISSLSRALALGVPLSKLSYQPDDAIHLPQQPIVGDWALALTSPDSPPWIAVTFHPLVDPYGGDQLISQLSNELLRISHSTAARLVFVPHATASFSNSQWADGEFGEALASVLRPNIELIVAPLMRAREVRWLTSHATMVISSRYHPIVFGLAAHRPSYAVVTTEYTRAKLEGALIHFDRGSDACSLGEALEGRLFEDCLRLWQERTAISVQLSDRSKTINQRELRRLNALGEGFKSGRPSPNKADYSLLIAHLATAVQRDAAAIAQLSHLLEATAVTTESLAQSRSKSEQYAVALKAEVTRLSHSLRNATIYAEQLERDRGVAETYAKSLSEKVAEIETYARSLEVELTKRTN